MEVPRHFFSNHALFLRGISLELTAEAQPRIAVSQEIQHMRRRKRVAMTAGLLVLIMWTVAAAVSPDRSTASPPLAVAQPVVLPAPLRPAPILGDSGMLLLVGSGLIALAALVRRTPPA